MENIDILSCIGCGRIVDQWMMLPKCEVCKGIRFRLVAPTKFNLLCWFINNPKHVIKLFIKDLKERYEARM